jgi:hypothetical protein
MESLRSLNWYLGPSGGWKGFNTNQASLFPSRGKRWYDTLGILFPVFRITEIKTDQEGRELAVFT